MEAPTIILPATEAAVIHMVVRAVAVPRAAALQSMAVTVILATIAIANATIATDSRGKSSVS